MLAPAPPTLFRDYVAPPTLFRVYAYVGPTQV